MPDVKKKVKILLRHPSHEFVPGEVVELDAKSAKFLLDLSAADDHVDAIANPTITRDDEGNVTDLELEKYLAQEKAKQKRQ